MKTEVLHLWAYFDEDDEVEWVVSDTDCPVCVGEQLRELGIAYRDLGYDSPIRLVEGGYDED